jgi:hypothetical protein
VSIGSGKLLACGVGLVGIIAAFGVVASYKSTAPSTAAGKPESSGVSCDVSPQVAPDFALHGAASGGEVWALPIGPYPPKAGELLKIVWRVTGSGPISLTAVGPDGRQHPPVQGPTEHFDSNFERPGDEWGAFFEFDRPGCWEIEARRGTVSGVVRIKVGEN